MARPIGGGGEQLQQARAGGDGAEGLAGRGETGQHHQPQAHRPGDDGLVGIGGDDQATARRVDAVHGRRGQHRARPHQGAPLEGPGEARDALQRVGGVQGHLDQAEPGGEGGLGHGHHLVRPHAPQDRHQGQVGQHRLQIKAHQSASPRGPTDQTLCGS